MGFYRLDFADKALQASASPFELEVTPEGFSRYRHAPVSMAATIDYFDQFSTREYLVFEEQRITYGEAKERILAMVDAFTRSGLKPGDRVAIAMRNFPEWVFGFFAITASGLIAVPLNAWWSADELLYGLRDSGAKLALVDQERAAMLSGGIDLPLWSRGSEEASDASVVMLDTCIQAARSESARLVEVRGDTPAAIFYTSGTTGRPKGVILTHENILQALYNALYLGARTILRAGGDLAAGVEQAINLVSIPLFHVTGCVAVLLPGTATGAKFILSRRFDPLEALELIQRERVTSFGGVPTVAQQILRHPERDRFDLSSVKTVSYGGAPSAPELVRMIERTSTEILPGNGYGLTETAGLVTFNNGVNYQERPSSAGPAVPVATIKVVDPFGEEVPDGQPGELLVRGSTVFAGYWGKEAESKAVFDDGWFRTGDIAVIDSDGYMHIVDRLKDLIIRGGENVATVEVEAAIFEYPGVEDVAVFGYPDDVLGERVAAAIVVQPSVVIDQEDLRVFLRDRLAGFKIPDMIAVRTEPLPRNAAGKLLKRNLRDEYSV
ncbi:class I adenylate-forming enzyme family protein [Ferrimicrobium acidiphilum]|jgi:long-chain acyl-CoA synthetase|uniref:Long-chain-fatty-acid--CoA ligase n=1 Tax=Ferrimicrobium acidiphilum DSM 19497 TaxID=1121877 RepID=A0A0D8FUR8_9ACTN|nr:class I adenylate-forming enzyme family protein [Ferrimicrobium acidiphilum]KJE76846.1 long-chain-fatty-acid--CoA ligase [Ferrimicrobium acidiphilum DSM 19497]MCL5053168.1 acyl--CoA ligase [Gammaproteobacteria bacterium]